jgi:BNR repeat-like domain
MIHGRRTLSSAGVNFAIAASVALLGPNVDVARNESPARPTASATFSQIENPSGHNSLAPTVSAGPKGELVLSWLESSAAQLSLRYSVWQGRAWGPVQTVVKRDNFDTYAEAPSIVQPLQSGALLAIWAEKKKEADQHGNYLLSAVSSDHGKSWSAPARIHTDASISEHSFSSVVADENGGATVVWLDARDYRAEKRYRLMSAVISSTGKVSAETTIDPDVCTCCPTSLTRTSKGLLTVYRGHNPDQIRDTMAARKLGDSWDKPTRVHEEAWKINGCPVNGPTVNARNNEAAVVWFTAKNDKPQIENAFSSDSGQTFSDAHLLDSAKDGSRPVGHITAALLPDGKQLVVWIRQSGASEQLVAQEIATDGSTGKLQVVAKGTTRALGYPHVELSGVNAVLTWGGTAEQPNVYTATLAVSR